VNRGLPYSILIHVVTLMVVIAYGNSVSTPTLKPERIFRVRITQAPAVQTTAPEQPPVQVEQPPEIVTPEPQPKTPPKLEPKQVPEKPREQPKPEQPEKQPAPELPAGPSVSSTDEPFQFAYYLTLIEGRITRHWNPRQLGFRESSQRSCVVHFLIDRSGYISQVTLTTPSGVALFDREALRAVQAAQPLPPLPPKYTARSLGVNFVFTLESGL